MLDYYEARKSQPLWYVAASFGDARPIVHTKASRWMKRGLREALLERGYDREGRKVAKNGQDTSIRDMYGTIKVHCSDAKALCKLEWPGVFALMKKVLVAAEAHLQRNQAGKHTTAPPIVNKNKANKTTKTVESWGQGKPASTWAKR